MRTISAAIVFKNEWQLAYLNVHLQYNIVTSIHKNKKANYHESITYCISNQETLYELSKSRN